MTKQVTDALIAHVCMLAELELGEEEQQQAKCDMQEMLNYIDILNELDTSQVEPLCNVMSYGNVLREDLVTNQEGSGELVRNAPEHHGCALVVPAVVSA